jgi:O-antigen/teichoic acid export membrane protein
MLWLIARTADAEQVGAYGLAQAWVLPVFAFLGLQLRALMATETCMHQLAGAYGRLRAISMSLGLSFLGLLWIREPFGPSSGALAAALGASRIVELGSDFADGLRHANREYLAIGASQVSRSTLSLLGFASAWMSTASLAPSLLAGTTAALISASVLDLPRLRFRKGGPDLRSEPCGASPSGATRPAALAGRLSDDWHLLSHALPLALVQFLNLGILYTPRVFLGAAHSMETVASFTCLASVLGAVSLTASSYSASLAPVFAASRDGESRSRLLRKALGRIALVVVPVAVVFAWLGRDLMRIVFGPGISFPRAAVAWTAVFVTLWSLATVFGTMATAQRRTLLQLFAFAAALVAGSLSCWLLAEPFGVTGATFSLTVSAITLLAVYHIPDATRAAFRPWAARLIPSNRLRTVSVDRSSL